MEKNFQQSQQNLKSQEEEEEEEDEEEKEKNQQSQPNSKPQEKENIKPLEGKEESSKNEENDIQTLKKEDQIQIINELSLSETMGNYWLPLFENCFFMAHTLELYQMAKMISILKFRKNFYYKTCLQNGISFLKFCF